MESILTSIKLFVNVPEELDNFDGPIIGHINTVFDDLNDLGVGPPEGFYIEDDSSVWTDFMPRTGKFESVKTYMQLRVQLLFDPPTNASILASMERQIEKLEWRLKVKAESTETNG